MGPKQVTGKQRRRNIEGWESVGEKRECVYTVMCVSLLATIARYCLFLLLTTGRGGQQEKEKEMVATRSQRTESTTNDL